MLAFLLMSAWVAFELWVGQKCGLWRSSLTKDAVIWFVTSALVLFFNIDKVSSRPHFLRRTAFEALGLSALLVAFTSLFVLNLFVELVLQPVVAVLAMLSVVAGTDEQYHTVKRLVDGLIAIIGVSLLVYAITVAVDTWSSVDKPELARQLALPVWLTIGLLPYIYLLGPSTAYGPENSVRINLSSADRPEGRLRSKLALVLTYHVRAHRLAEFGGAWQLGQARTFREARRIIRNAEREAREFAEAAGEARDRLTRFVGIEGVDKDGRRLDRREFEETTEALGWLANCMGLVPV